eukprot:CAMPEP_0167799002 /NCGR_PEP_ID=MMETSP0111_2-20121227/16710_1 /TAXON_ID=91324 /ORGANISM="Lotharella globosa, Strain CCCM811" /LENGTH=64 /DNA_ID=CAMNT_0007693655 /DNA_START=254 /DNA_END=448 /DNA_ORIENTATION=-
MALDVGRAKTFSFSRGRSGWVGLPALINGVVDALERLDSTLPDDTGIDTTVATQPSSEDDTTVP